jgi:tRNA threonylcarbamoyladenosine biosynthesis protein TsaB
MQTSNGVPMMGLAQDGVLTFDSAADEALLGSREYRNVLTIGLERIGARVQDITEIFVDIGPGGLGVTRTGVAFANALGFALGLPTAGIPAFELLGAQAAVDHAGTVVILRKAARPYVHFGLFTDGVLSHYEHCKQDHAEKTIVPLDGAMLIGNVTLEAGQSPEVNAATLHTMLRVAQARPSVDAAARAHPIVDIVT